MNVDQMLVVPGLRPTFFPMRPTTGFMIRSVENIDEILTQVASGSCVIQPKLNGDRATLTVIDGEVYIFNRHGSGFKHAVINCDDFGSLPSFTTLDGEVYGRHFTPFEALVVGGRSLMEEDVRVRIEAAKAIALKYDEWLFETPTRDWLVKTMAEQRPLGSKCKWEGVVKKATGQPYQILGADNQDSGSWLKHKWTR